MSCNSFSPLNNLTAVFFFLLLVKFRTALDSILKWVRKINNTQMHIILQWWPKITYFIVWRVLATVCKWIPLVALLASNVLAKYEGRSLSLSVSVCLISVYGTHQATLVPRPHQRSRGFKGKTKRDTDLTQTKLWDLTRAPYTLVNSV